MKLWNHQQDAIKFQSTRQGTLLNHGMASGKTCTAISICQSKNHKTILIVCPVSVIQTWVDEFDKFTTDEFSVLALTKGSVVKKTEAAEKFLKQKSSKKKVIVLNYESAWRPGLGPIRDKHRRITDYGLLKKINWDIIICDECHKICAPGSNVSKFFASLSQPKDGKTTDYLGLTGTPFEDSPLEAYGIFRFLDRSIFGTSFFHFKHRYAEMGGFQNKEVRGYVNMDDFKEKIDLITHTVKTDDVIELPDIVHRHISCELSSKAMKMYKEFQNELILEFKDSVLSAENVLVKGLRLSQIASGVVTDDLGSEHVIDDAKIRAAKDIVDGLPKSEPIVVFARFRAEIARVKEILEPRKKHSKKRCSELSGSVNELAEWKAGKTQIICVSIQAGGAGIDLSRARYTIYMSTGYSRKQYLQSLARTRRPGSDLKQKIIYYHLNATGTIDYQIIKALEKKEKISDIIFNSVGLCQRAA